MWKHKDSGPNAKPALSISKCSQRSSHCLKVAVPYPLSRKQRDKQESLDTLNCRLERPASVCARPEGKLFSSGTIYLHKEEEEGQQSDTKK